MPCIFCGNPKLSREHIYRRGWIERLLPEAESHTHRLARGYGEPVPLATWTSPEADLVVRCVCADCNNGWMNDLDHQAEPVLDPMCQGELRVRVEPGAAELVATWAVKMAFVLDCMLTPPVLQQDDRETFFRERTPPRGFVVWVATMESFEEETRTTPMTLVPGPEFGTAEQAFLATFRVLHLVIQVLGPTHPNVRPERDAAGAAFVEAVWPRDVTLEWPLPRERMLRSEEDYVELTRSFRSGEIVRPPSG